MKTDFEIQLEKQARKWFESKSRDKYYAFEGDYYKPFIGPDIQYLKLDDVDVLFIKSLLVEIYNEEFAGDDKLESYDELFEVIDLCEFKGRHHVLDMLIFEPLDELGFVLSSVDLDTVYYPCEMSYIAYDKERKTISEPECFVVALTDEEYICMMVYHMMSSAGMNYIFMMNPKLGQKIVKELWEECFGQPSLIICDEIEAEVASLLNNASNPI